jgi:hypothetical protein
LITPVTTPFAFLGHHVVVRRSHGFRRPACITLIPKGTEPPNTRAHQATLPAQPRSTELARSAPQVELDPSRLERLLPPRVGSEDSLLIARLLRVVVGVSLAAEETSTRTGEDTEGALSIEGPRDSSGAVAPSWGHPLHLGENSRRPISADFSPPTPLRDSSWRAGCITKGACPVRKGALGNLPARAGKAPSVHLTAQASRARIDSIEGGRSPERSRRSEDTPEARPPRIEEAARRTTRVRDEGTLRHVPLRDDKAPSRAAHAAGTSARGGPRRGDRARHAINRSANPFGFSKRPPVPGQIAPSQGPTLRAYSPASAPNAEARCKRSRLGRISVTDAVRRVG